MRKIRIPWFGTYLIIFFLARPPLSHAQIETISSTKIQQVPRAVVALLLKKDICKLIDHLEIPPIPKREWGAFFSTPSRAQTQMRLQRDELLRKYINCIREYILIFSRFSVTERSKMAYNTRPADFQDHFISKIEIGTFTSPLADTFSPDLAHKSIIITFHLNFKYSEKGWKITNIYNFGFHPN